jgi:hypothetical protein
MSASTATGIMQTFGNTKSIKINRNPTSVLDPIEGKFSLGRNQVIDTLAVVGRVPNSAIDGKRVFSGDKQITISADTPVLVNDTISISGVEYKVTLIDAPMVNDEILYYKVIWRG